MWSRSVISCSAFCKRAAICIEQHLSRNYLSCEAQYGVFAQQNHRARNFRNYCYGINIKKFDLSSSTKCVQVVFHGNTLQHVNQAGCHGQHIMQLRSLSTNEKVTSSSDVASEHWGPYLVSRIHSLEESSRFHGYSTLRWGLSVIVTVLASVYLFRDQLRDNVADEVADVASRSMGMNVNMIFLIFLTG